MLHGLPAGRDLLLGLGQNALYVVEFGGLALGQPGQEVVFEHPVDMPAPFLGQIRGQHLRYPLLAAPGLLSGTEDLGEDFDERSGFGAAAPVQLERQEINASVEQPAVKGEFGFDLVRHPAPVAQHR